MISKSKAFFYFEAELIVTLKLCDKKDVYLLICFVSEVVKLLFIDFIIIDDFSKYSFKNKQLPVFHPAADGRGTHPQTLRRQ